MLINLLIIFIIGGIVGWIGWHKFVKEVPGSLVASLFAGWIGVFFGMIVAIGLSMAFNLSFL